MITVAEALAILRKTCSPGPVERAPLREGAGRVLARDVRADVAWPPFDTSAMDGYAVRLDDFAPGKGPVAERPGFVGAGDKPPAPLSPGEAVRIMTGAPVPAGTEAIVPVEKVRRENGDQSFGMCRACDHIWQGISSMRQLRISIDEHPHRDGAKPGNEVRVFLTKDGYAAYIQKLEP